MGTKCEVVVVEYLRSLGYKFRTNDEFLPGRPDICFERERVVIFIDGDFWHGKNLKKRLSRLSQGHNSEYWTAKITNNFRRDRAVDKQLKAAKWNVVRIWESDVVRNPAKEVMKITRALARARRRKMLARSNKLGPRPTQVISRDR